MAYSPPNYNAVDADLKPTGSAAVTIANFNAVNVELSVDPTGAPAPPQTLIPAGFVSDSFGGTQIRLQKQPINLDGFGFDSAEVSEEATVANLADALYPDGIGSTLEVGDPEISFGLQTIDCGYYGGIDSFESGEQDIQNYYRTIEPAWYGESLVSPVAEISYSARYVPTQGFESLEFGEVHADLKTRHLNQIGWFTSTFGDALVWDGIQTLQLSGWQSSLIGGYVVAHYVAPTTTRTIELSGKAIDVPEFQVSAYHSAANVNRQVFPDTFTTHWVSSPTLEQPDYFSMFPLGQDWSEFGTAFADQTVYRISPDGWASSYVSPSHQASENIYGVHDAGGFRSSAFGAHNLYYGAQRPQPPGIASKLALGEPWVSYAQRLIAPAGLDATLWGDALLQFSLLYVGPGGVAPPPDSGPAKERALPTPTIAYRTQVAADAGGFSTHAVPEPIITAEFQYVALAGRSIDDSTFGVPEASFRYRAIYPAFTVSMEFGAAAVHHGLRIAPSGWGSALVGEDLELLSGKQRVYQASGAADEARYGMADVRNYNTLAGAQTWASSEFAFPVVYNLRQIVGVLPFKDNLDPDEWPNYAPFVENAARTLGPSGILSSRVSFYVGVSNAAAPLLPEGLDAALWGTAGVGHRIRFVQPQGFDSFYSTHYTGLHNTADVLAPGSLGAQSVVGRPDPVANLNRTVKHHTPWEGALWGLPFVAYGVRRLHPAQFLDVPNGIPEVRFNPYPLKPAGIPQAGQVGGHFVEERFTYILPKSVNVFSVSRCGEPFITNRTQTLPHFGNDVSLYGRPDIQNRIRRVEPGGIAPDDIERPYIGRRTRELAPPGAGAPDLVVLHRIRNLLPDPPGPQTIQLWISLAGVYDPDAKLGTGLGFDALAMGVPDMGVKTIYPLPIPEQAQEDTQYGRPTVTTNTIAPPFFFEDRMFGIPIIAGPRRIFPNSVEPTLRLGEQARMSPWHIYGPVGDQAPANYNPRAPGERIRNPLDPRDVIDVTLGFPWFGEIAVSHFHRTIGPVPGRGVLNAAVDFDAFPQFGEPSLELRRRVIAPVGIRPVGVGLVRFGDIIQHITLDDEDDLLTDPDQSFHYGLRPSTRWGDTEIHFPRVAPDSRRYIYTADNDLTLWSSDHLVELKNRRVYPVGIEHRSNPEHVLPRDRDPWGDALVGYPRVYEIGMGVVALWGETTIEYLHRQVFPVGSDTSSFANFSLDDFRLRMRVVRRNPLAAPASWANMSVFGATRVEYRHRTVAAQAVAGNALGAPSLSAVTRIAVSGWLSEVVGNIDRWEAGKVKAHGDDTSALGTPRILNPLRPAGIDALAFGAPAAARALGALGILPPALIGPSLTNPQGCNTRVITPLPVLPVQHVPEPEIA